MTLDRLNELANSVPDSRDTIPGEILFFRLNSSAGEALKKLKNHNFKIGYAFTIILDDKEYTKIVAYNQKNDIFRGWMGPVVLKDGSIDMKFPIHLGGFSCYLNMLRYDATGKLKLYQEDFRDAARATMYAKKKFENLPHLEKVDNLLLYDNYFPVLENPQIELNRRLKIKTNPDKDGIFYSDVAAICNIYKFNDTYELFDDGLKEIYKTLFDNREVKFCQEIKAAFENPMMLNEVLNDLNLDMSDVQDIFERNGLEMPVIEEKSHSKERKFLKGLKTIIYKR